jgi:hypothetical protein
MSVPFSMGDELIGRMVPPVNAVVSSAKPGAGLHARIPTAAAVCRAAGKGNCIAHTLFFILVPGVVDVVAARYRNIRAVASHASAGPGKINEMPDFQIP